MTNFGDIMITLEWLTDEELNEVIMECQRVKRERRIERFRKTEDKTQGF